MDSQADPPVGQTRTPPRGEHTASLSAPPASSPHPPASPPRLPVHAYPSDWRTAAADGTVLALYLLPLLVNALGIVVAAVCLALSLPLRSAALFWPSLCYILAVGLLDLLPLKPTPRWVRRLNERYLLAYRRWLSLDLVWEAPDAFQESRAYLLGAHKGAARAHARCRPAAPRGAARRCVLSPAGPSQHMNKHDHFRPPTPTHPPLTPSTPYHRPTDPPTPPPPHPPHSL